ncbi:MAG: type II secretion system minor pseudopilin GspJ, partial [Pseudomonadota bacterium]
MRSRRRVGSASGFTLVEVLVALAITVAVTVTAYTSISAALASAEQLQQNGDRVRDLNRALTILSRDVRQLTNRQVKDEFDDVRAALEGGPLAPHSLALTRSGWHSDGVSPRSNLQRVFYYVEDDSLWRAYYQVLDRLGDREPVRVRLLRGVEDMEVRFLQDIQQLQVSRDLKIDSRNWPRNWV